MILGRLRAADLKENYPKWRFVLKEITYLGYFITKEGNKPNPKKVQGIMDMGRSATNT